MNLKYFKRKQVTLSTAKLIKTDFLQPKQHLPLLIEPLVKGIDLATWAASNLNWIETQLLNYGGLIFRGFKINQTHEFEHFITTVSKQLVEYSYRSTPRTQVDGKIYTSTEYPAEHSIPLHNEMAYSKSWPMKIWFFCVKAAESGGKTPIADSRKVFQRLDPKIKKRFIEKKVMYVRNYGQGLDLQWSDVFQTNDKSAVENYCNKAGIEFEWRDKNNLRTRQVCQAVATHPTTGAMVWFNQAHLFHISSLKTEVRQSLLEMLREEDLPRNAFYGDGSPIESSIVAEIQEIYQQEAVLFPWQEGDILMLDNMLTAHGRQPFVGQRKIVVGMAEPWST